MDYTSEFFILAKNSLFCLKTISKLAILLLLCKTTNHVLQLEYPVASNGAKDAKNAEETEKAVH